jgi:hypothetical protein
LALGHPGTRAELIALDLDADLGSLGEVLEPAGMVGRAALRRDDDRRVAVEPVDERRRGLVARPAAGSRQQQDRRAFLPVVPDLAVGLPVATDVLLA